MGGFMSMSETPNLVNIQCEACHGNSAQHSRSPKVKTPGNARAVCVGCHTEEQTESFAFETYWPRIAH
jgi:predicted CXXCH cytochrome family protein